VKHENIIQLYEIYETQNEIFLVMEYAEGGELFEFIVKKTRIPED
jgi:serine/threonine protein kinase